MSKISIRGTPLWLIIMTVGCSAAMSGCGFCFPECIPKSPLYRLPYGARFVKPGMTREQRLQDSKECDSTANGLIIYFPPEQKKAARTRLPNGDFLDDGWQNLMTKFESCMTAKGYYELSTCGGQTKEDYIPCMYP